MAEHRQRPQQAPGAAVAFVVVGDHMPFRGQAEPRTHFAQPRFVRQQAHRRRFDPDQIGIVEMDCAGDVAGGVTGRIGQIHDEDPGSVRYG